jgi:hypothetical protein
VEYFPGDGMLGGGRKDSGNGRRWIIDRWMAPRFRRGNPNWAVLIGFEAAASAGGIRLSAAMDQMFCAAHA